MIIEICMRRDNQFGIDIPLNKGHHLQLHFPKAIYYEGKENREYLRLFSYPIGNFKEIAQRCRDYGEIPKFELEFSVSFVPAGVVISAEDHITGDIARSMAIPYAVFERVLYPTETVELKS